MFDQKVSTLHYYFFVSLGIHLILFSVIMLIKPNIMRSELAAQVSINLNMNSGNQSSLQTPVPAPVNPQTTPKQSTSSPVASQTTPKQSTSSPAASQTTPKQSTSSPAASLATSKQENISQTQPDIKQIQEKTISSTQPEQLTSTVPVQNSSTSKTDLEKLLDQKQKSSTTSDSDFLSDGRWSGNSRKTTSFPDLTKNIPQKYKRQGYGVSITVKLTFSPEGWVSSLQIIKSSGDPYIDNLFRNELRTVRIEPIQTATYDTIIKTFNVSIR
ncbi:MAG: hypothetical protein ACRCTQ_06895 [Brevinemataceae bacterium]